MSIIQATFVAIILFFWLVLIHSISIVSWSNLKYVEWGCQHWREEVLCSENFALWPYLGRFNRVNELCEPLADDGSEFHLVRRPIPRLILFTPPGSDRGPLYPLRKLLRIGCILEPVLGHSEGDEEVVPIQPDLDHSCDPHLHPTDDAARGCRYPT